jgi:hypothetical protein
MSSNALAATDNHSTCRDLMLKVTNLKNVNFADRASILEGANTLLANANGDAYQLSLPLLISAHLGDEKLYHDSSTKMDTAMQSPALGTANQNSFRAWMYGRMLIAAKNMGDQTNADKTLIHLKNVLNDKNTYSDRFTAWAWGYLASFNDQEYQAAKNEMELLAAKLTAHYVDVNKSNESADKKQEARSDALWAWVMNAQAAANANDMGIYHHALERMQFITGEHTVSDALSKGLLRTSASNDYPAWAIGMTRVDAITILDRKLYMELDDTLKNSIDASIKAQAKAETFLAQVNREWALERQKALDQCK